MAFKYGIKLVWAGWTDKEALIGFSESAYRIWKDTIGVRTRMLIYEVSDSGTREPDIGGRMTIVAEVEVTGPFTPDNILAPTAEHSNTVPVKIVQSEADVNPVPASKIREITNDKDFPRQGDTWLKLDDNVYEQLIAEMKKSPESSR